MLHLKDFSVGFGENAVLQKINLKVSAGERLAVIGPNGSGKSTLALAAAGVIPDFVEAVVSGKIERGECGLIMQSPSPQFFAMSVREELGSRGIEQAEKLGLLHLLGRNVFELSEGEKQKVNLAANLSFNPAGLLLDEPLELLDPVEAARFRQLLGRAKRVSLIWLDKENPAFFKAKKIFLGKQERAEVPEKKSNVKGGTALKANFSIKKNGFSLKANFSVSNGEKVGLIGKNGSGKTTMLKAVAGIERFSGKISFQGRASLAPQNPSHIFFRETAGAELSHPANAKKLGISPLLNQNPCCLSRGQQKLLSLAAISSEGIGLLDEPTTWLDAKNKAAVYRFISESSQPMLIATHDRQLLQYCDTVFLIEGGEARECSSTAANRFFRA